MLKWIDQPGYLSSNLPWPIHKLVQAAAHSRSICDLGAGILCNVSGCVSLKGSQATGPTSAREVHNLYIQVTSSILYNYIEVVFQKFCSCIVLPDFFRIQIIQAYLEKDVILFVRFCGVSKGRLCKKTIQRASFLISSVKLVAVMPVVFAPKVMLQSGNMFNLHVLIAFLFICFPKMPSQKWNNPLLCKNFPEGPSCDGIRSMMLQSSGLWDSNSSDSDDISYWGSKLFAK